MRYVYAAVLLALGSCVAWAAPPEVPALLSASPGEIVEVPIKIPDGAKLGYRLTGGKALLRELKSEQPGERVFWFSAKSVGVYEVVWWTGGETASIATVITVGAPVPPAPDPKPVDPKPVDPKPVDPIKVESFRVIFVYEKSSTGPSGQYSVIYGKAAATFLDANCTKTGTFPDWRIFDKDDQAVTETGKVKELWKAVKAKLPGELGRPAPKLPLVAIEVNGKVVLESLPETPAAAVALFKKYLGEK